MLNGVIKMIPSWFFLFADKKTRKVLDAVDSCYYPFRSCPAIIINNAFHGILKKRNAETKKERKLILFEAIAGIFFVFARIPLESAKLECNKVFY